MPNVVTCHTAGCVNEGVPVSLELTVPDPETGDPVRLAAFCGPCGQPITDIEEGES